MHRPGGSPTFGLGSHEPDEHRKDRDVGMHVFHHNDGQAPEQFALVARPEAT